MRFREALVPLMLALVALSPATAADHVTTSSAGGLKKNYPLEVPDGAFVEVVQVGGLNISTGPLRVKFTDGRVANNLFVSNQTYHGFKFAGVSQIEFPGSQDHAILWRITPAGEFGDEGARHVSVIPGLPANVPGAGYTVPGGKTVRILQCINTGFEGVSPDWASVRLTSSVPALSSGGFVPTPSSPIPFLTSVFSDTFLLLEVRDLDPDPAAPVRVTVEQSADLRMWEPLDTIEVAPTEAKAFFRARIER